MKKKQKSDSLFNTSIGILPWLLFVIIQDFISYESAIVTAMVSWFALMFYFYKINDNQIIRILLKIIGITLVFDIVAPLLSIPENYTTLFSELVLLVFLWVFSNFRNKISRHYLRFESSYSKREKALAFNGLFYVIRLYWNALFTHIVIVVIYFMLPEKFHIGFLDQFLYKYLGILLISLIVIYEHIKLSHIKKNLSKEDWLPVTNESGRIIGKVAKQISLNAGNRFLHPLIRIALIYKGKLFLSERPRKYIMEPGRVDYPFERHLKFDQTLDEAVNQLIASVIDASKVKTRFAFKYLYQGTSANRLVYLYTLPIHNEDVFSKMQLSQGKVWTEKQIEENLQKNLFSDLFEKEYDIIKHTILMAERLICEKHT